METKTKKSVCVAIPVLSDSGGRPSIPVLNDVLRIGKGLRLQAFVATNAMAIDEDSWNLLKARDWTFHRATNAMTEPMFWRWFYALLKEHPSDLYAIMPPGAFLLDGTFRAMVEAWEEIGDATAAMVLTTPLQQAKESASAHVQMGNRNLGQAWMIGLAGAKRLASWDPEIHGQVEMMFDQSGIWQMRQGVVSTKAPTLNLLSDPIPEEPVPVSRPVEGPVEARSRLRDPAPRPSAFSDPIHPQLNVPNVEIPSTPRTPRIDPGKASFLVATHHRPRLLKACLELLVAQDTPPNWRWDILVGGMADDPGKEVAKTFPGVRWIDCPGPTVTAKLNTLLAATDAELVLKADDDDLQPPDRLSAATAAYENGALMAGVGRIAFYSLDDDRAMEWVGRANMGLIGTGMSFSASLLREAGGWPAQAQGEDGAVMTRIRQIRPSASFSDLTETMGCITALQHGTNIYQRPSVDKGAKTSRGGFAITGLGTLAEAKLPLPVQHAIQVTVRGMPEGTVVVPPKPVATTVSVPMPGKIFGERSALLTCFQGQFGQAAFVDGLQGMGFQAISFEEAKKQLGLGNPVLFHGWRDQYVKLGDKYPNLVAILWHSGWTGSDLMGEGRALADALAAARQGTIKLFWLERRDAVPQGAVPLAPIWSPEGLKHLASGAGRKRPKSVMVAFHGAWSAACKNDLAGIAACAGIPGVELHVSRCSLEGPRGAAAREILRGVKHIIHDPMPREAAIRLMAEMEVVCHPSISDTWPYSTLEAVHCGTPVVASDAVSWTRSLPDWARKACVPTAATASLEIRNLVKALLDNPEAQRKLQEAQQSTLQTLLQSCKAEFIATVTAAGFPIKQIGMTAIPPKQPIPPKPSCLEALIDSPDWAFDRIVDQLEKNLGIGFRKAFVRDGEKIDSGIVFWWRGHLRHVKDPANSLLVIYDFLSWDAKTAADVFSRFKVLGVANKKLLCLLQDVPELAKKTIHVLADGVDTKMFNPGNRMIPNAFGKLRVGWVGNLDWGGKAADHKGSAILAKVMEQTADICDWQVVDRQRNPKAYKDMPAFYRELDIITCFSDMEGTPNPALEGAACGCLVLSTDVGLLPEMAETGVVVDIVDRTEEAFVERLRKLHSDRSRLEEARKRNPAAMAKSWDWSVKSESWREALDELRGIRPKKKTDLRNQVTVFVTTVGAPDFKECLAHLEAQDCQFKLEIIRNVSPMNAAFQKMIDDCRTPFYVQVDEDMLLDPDAVRLLYEGLLRKPKKMAIFFKALRDRFTNCNLIGVKIYRHEAMVAHPYDPRDFSCEVDQVERLKKSGWLVDGDSPGLHGDPSKCVGDLNAFWTPWGVFEKYNRDMQKLKLYPKRLSWMKTLPEVFRKKMYENPSDPIAMAAFLGASVGLMTPVNMVTGEKNFKEQIFREPFNTLVDLLNIEPNKVWDVRGLK